MGISPIRVTGMMRWPIYTMATNARGASVFTLRSSLDHRTFALSQEPISCEEALVRSAPRSPSKPLCQMP